MTIYVVEIINDYAVQCGWTLDKKRAELVCRELKKTNPRGDYFVTEYTLEKPSDFCEFD